MTVWSKNFFSNFTFVKIWIINTSFGKTSIITMLNNSTILKLNINIIRITISNNSHEHTTIWYLFLSYSITNWIAYAAFGKTGICFVFYNGAIIKLNINIFVITINNNFHFSSIFWYFSFTQTLGLRICYFTTKETAIVFMLYNSAIVKLNVDISVTCISDYSHI